MVVHGNYDSKLGASAVEWRQMMQVGNFTQVYIVDGKGEESKVVEVDRSILIRVFN